VYAVYKECKTEQSAKRQYDVEQVFLDLLLTKNYNEITVCELCTLANIPRKAFYRYFDDKAGVLHALIHHTLIRYGEFSAKSTNARRTVKSEIEQFFLYWKENKQRKLLKALGDSDLLNELISISIDFSNSRLLNLNKFFDEEDSKISEEIFCFIITGLMALMLSWHREGYKRPTSEMAEITCRLLTAPVFPNLSEWGIYDE
jgi:AcrR family transcriptional regulator